MVPQMFEWPRFATLRAGVASPERRLAVLLDDLANVLPAPSAGDVLAALFDDEALVAAVERLTPRVHHAGLIAPPGLAVPAVTATLRASPFRNQLRTFKSAVLAKDLSFRLAANVNVTVVQGTIATAAGRSTSVEIFVADLSEEQTESLLAQETGCHVALALDPSGSFNRLLEVLHTHGCWEIPLMRNGPLPNDEIHSSVLYVDIPNGERMRRLEFIASSRVHSDAASSSRASTRHSPARNRRSNASAAS
jgi:hypothetical protein